MKCCFINAGPLSQGIELVKKDLGIEIAKETDTTISEITRSLLDKFFKEKEVIKIVLK